MRRFIVVLSLAFAAVAPAQQVLQCVNPDALNSLVFNMRAESRLVIRRAMPDNVAGFRAPSGFALIGSSVRASEPASTVVAYKTTLERGRALDSLLGFMSDEGWSRETAPQVQQPPVAVASPMPTTATLCRNGERRGVRVQEIEGVRYATITGSVSTPARACGVPVPQQQQQVFGGNPMATEAARGIMPQFTLPESARVSGRGGMDSGSSESSMGIQSPDSADTLVRHLAAQLQAQGWRSDAEWKGALSTGSTWVRRNDAGQPFWGTLEILNRGDGAYEVSYSVATRPQ